MSTPQESVEVKTRGAADDILEGLLTAIVQSSEKHDVSVVVPALVEKLGGFSQSASANVTLASLIFWVKVTLESSQIKKRFDGDSGGIGTPGGNPA
jgi:hypothetical protein